MSWILVVSALLIGNVIGQDTRWTPVVRVLFPEEKLLQRSYAQCDSTVKTKEGWIYTPNYPADYDNLRTCIYVIERASNGICQVEMTVIDFDLQESDGCFNDYLEIQDGRQNQRLCGTLPTGTKKTLYFAPGVNTITMRFQSDAQLTFKGFMLHLKQLKGTCTELIERGGGASCDQFINTFRGRITSPGFPNGYPPGQVCKYTIQRADSRVCKVQFIFKTFHIEPSGNECTKDYLELPDRSRLCGHYVPRKIFEYPTGSQIMMLKFMSDYYGSGQGFDIEVVQIENSCRGYQTQPPYPSHTTYRPYPPPPPTTSPPGRCDQEVVHYTGKFTSPGFPGDYGPREYCVYTIKRPNPYVCVVELDFLVFDLEYGGTSCNRDYLELPDRTRLCGKISGTRQLKYEPASNSLILRFSSDAYSSGRGFDIRVRQKHNSCSVSPNDCVTEITGFYGRLTSPGYPRKYGPSLRCRYTITRPDYSTCKVQLLFRVFDVAYSVNCVQDYLELPDRTKLCGSYVQTKTIMYPDSHSRNLVLYFVTNSAGNGRGFDIDVRQLPNSCKKQPPSSSCDKTIKGDNEIITSPGYPLDYPRNVQCTYTIQSFSLTTCRIRLEFLDFDLEDSAGCTADFLEIPSLGEKLCGAKKPPARTVPFASGSDTLDLIFKSDSQTTRPGFQIKMTQLTNSCYRPVVDPKICQTVTEATGVITTDNYPSPYNPDTDCYYQIVKYNSAVCQVHLYFAEFLVGSENDAACVEDFLEVQEIRYCGNRRGENVIVGFPADKSDLLLHFTTDSYKERTGFRIEVRQVTEGCKNPKPDGCDATYSTETFQIVSPGYQIGTYSSNLDCKYTIKKFDFKVCALEIKYYIFDLEESEDCKKDYLKVGELKLCGRLAYDSIRTYEFLEDNLLITFHTDEHRNSAGFFLSVKQIKC